MYWCFMKQLHGIPWLLLTIMPYGDSEIINVIDFDFSISVKG